MGLDFSAVEMDPQSSKPTCLGQLCIPFQQQVGPKTGNQGRYPKGSLLEEEKLKLGFGKWVRLGRERHPP